MKNITELLASHPLLINMNKHLLGNIFISKNKYVFKSLSAMPKKLSLPTSNLLESKKSACN